MLSDQCYLIKWYLINVIWSLLSDQCYLINVIWSMLSDQCYMINSQHTVAKLVINTDFLVSTIVQSWHYYWMTSLTQQYCNNLTDFCLGSRLFYILLNYWDVSSCTIKFKSWIKALNFSIRTFIVSFFLCTSWNNKDMIITQCIIYI
jgi:hypothetical protein